MHCHGELLNCASFSCTVESTFCMNLLSRASTTVTMHRKISLDTLKHRQNRSLDTLYCPRSNLSSFWHGHKPYRKNVPTTPIENTTLNISYFLFLHDLYQCHLEFIIILWTICQIGRVARRRSCGGQLSYFLDAAVVGGRSRSKGVVVNRHPRW